MRSEQELSDALHELDIQRAGIFVEQAMLAGDRDNATFWAKQQAAMIGERSPAQVERMEKGMGWTESMEGERAGWLNVQIPEVKKG